MRAGGPPCARAVTRVTDDVRSDNTTRSTDERAHNDDGALAGLDPGQVGCACSNTRDGGRRERLETCALAPGRRRRVVCCAAQPHETPVFCEVDVLGPKINRFEVLGPNDERAL